VLSPGSVATILGNVNLPSASLHVSILPACASTVSDVSAVKLTTLALPADINPAKDFTGPENVDFAIISSLGNKFYHLGLSARSVGKTS
jgi:hypothetical protein